MNINNDNTHVFIAGDVNKKLRKQAVIFSVINGTLAGMMTYAVSKMTRIDTFDNVKVQLKEGYKVSKKKPGDV